MTKQEKQSAVIPDPSKLPSLLGAPKLGRGHEDETDADDYNIPRAKIIQYTSDEAQAEKAEDRVEPGKLINSITKEELPFFFIPVFRFVNFIQWNPRKKNDPNFDPGFEPGEIVFQSIDRKDPRVAEGIKFGPNGEAPKVTKYINFFCHFVGNNMPLVLSFSKTSISAGKDLNTMLEAVGGDMFQCKFQLVVTQRESDGAKFFVLGVKAAGKASKEEFALAESWYDHYRGAALKVHMEEEKSE